MKVKVDIDVHGAHEVEEAAELLDVGVATIWRWIREHKIASFKLGDRTLIPAVAIEEIKKRRSPPGQGASSSPGTKR